MHWRARAGSLLYMASDAMRARSGSAVVSYKRILAWLRRKEDDAANDVR